MTTLPNTPRMRSAFPSTPQAQRRSHASPTGGSKLSSPLPDISTVSSSGGREDADGPLIPLDTLDAPQQRLYVVAFYVALLAWRLYDYSYLQEEETESLWLFMKWVMFDGIFLFGLPELRIPWLEFSSPTTTVLFLAHALLDGILMFRIPIPIGAGLAAITKLFYDREMAINERHVKHASIMHNSSLILGKQIIHILPEGSSILNPARLSFCIDSSTPQVYLPIQINQTTPIGIDLLRLDFDGVSNETIHITASQIKKMTKEATKSKLQHADNEPLLLKYPAKKTGMYVLHKVVDESKLEVQRRRAGDTMVVSCPKALLKPSNPNRCKGDLSDVELEVTGTPPLRIKYRKMINQVEQEAHFQSIQPDDFVSPLSGTSEALTLRTNKDISWARPQSVTVPLTEQFGISGRWVYSLEEVQDAFGNAVSYTQRDHDDQEKPRVHSPHLHQVITVHERPTVRMNGCNDQKPLQVAKGRPIILPVDYSSTGKGGFLDSPYELDYLFTPENELLPSGDHSDSAQQKQITIKNVNQRPNAHLPGLYSLNGVSTEFCAGDVLEPASCLLQNPPEPSLKINMEEIFDKCANKAVGLRLDLHLTGTPPFHVKYRVIRGGDRHHDTQVAKIDGLRGQIELTPPKAGHYIYDFTEVSDSIYKGFQVQGDDLIIEQDVKPSASANFVEQAPQRMVCIDQPVSFDVALRGEGPFTLEYELIRGNSRKPFTISDVTGEVYNIKTDTFVKGGDYTLALASITDRMGCKEFLKQEAKITVRHQKPKAGFGHIEGGRSVKTLQGKKVSLPLRLTGDAPWTVGYRSVADGREHQIKVGSANAEFSIQEAGTYELIHVHDRICPGAVDPQANKFDVSWIPRPRLALAESSFVGQESGKFIKHDICEGDEDAVDVHFQGSPPFEVKYEEHLRPDKGSKALKNKALNAALSTSSIQLDTSQPGMVEYKFVELGDYNYDHDGKHFTPVTIQQRVNPRPMARFSNPGKTYSYCTVESIGEEVIPITLTGVPPFNIEVELKHHGSAKAEHYSFDSISKNTFDLRIPHKTLQLGNSAVSIRKVTDSRGCNRVLDVASTPRVHISVHDAPQIRALESQDDFCVGDRLNFALSGQAPFTVYYSFNGVERKATVKSTMFRRLAEKPGTFVITGLSDAGSSCKATTSIVRTIHGMPSVQVSKGRESVVDIHEGGEAEITFDFGGTPPFEFTWIRSTNARRGQKSEVLEMKSEVSQEYSLNIRASEEGTYEVVSIKDAYCAYSKEGIDFGKSKKGSKLLTY